MISDSMTGPYPLVREVLGDSYGDAERFDLTHGWTAMVVPDPGRSLPGSTKDAIYQALVPVSSASFGADMTEYWRDRSTHDYFGRLAEFVTIADDEGRMVGWTGHSVLDSDWGVNVYIDSSGVVPSGQSRGVMRTVMTRRLTQGVLALFGDRERLFISARSESPVFYKLMRGIVGADHLFPHPDLRLPADVLRCGRELALWLNQAALMEADSLVIRNAYAVLEELYAELPSTGDAALDRMFRNSLGPLDAYLLVGVASGPGQRVSAL